VKCKRCEADTRGAVGEGVADIMNFKAQVNGNEATEEAGRIQVWQGLLDWQLADRFDMDRPVLLLPGSWWSLGSTS